MISYKIPFIMVLQIPSHVVFLGLGCLYMGAFGNNVVILQLFVLLLWILTKDLFQMSFLLLTFFVILHSFSYGYIASFSLWSYIVGLGFKVSSTMLLIFIFIFFCKCKWWCCGHLATPNIDTQVSLTPYFRWAQPLVILHIFKNHSHQW
jgi:hypothetical protein